MKTIAEIKKDDDGNIMISGGVSKVDTDMAIIALRSTLATLEKRRSAEMVAGQVDTSREELIGIVVDAIRHMDVPELKEFVADLRKSIDRIREGV